MTVPTSGGTLFACIPQYIIAPICIPSLCVFLQHFHRNGNNPARHDDTLHREQKFFVTRSLAHALLVFLFCCSPAVVSKMCRECSFAFAFKGGMTLAEMRGIFAMITLFAALFCFGRTCAALMVPHTSIGARSRTMSYFWNAQRVQQCCQRFASASLQCAIKAHKLRSIMDL